MTAPSQPDTLGAALRFATAELAHRSGARQDAAALVCDAAGLSLAQLLARLDEPLTERQTLTLVRHVERRVAGEPLAYVLGQADFFGLRLVVTPAVLVPRPETELLAAWAVDRLRSRPQPRTALDVGTGSGALALALAQNVPHLQVVATDVSPAALEVARANAARLGLAQRVRFDAVDLVPDDPQRFDLVVANLPYVAPDDPDLAPEVRAWEPAVALFGGADGLELIRRLLERLPSRLAPGAAVGLEIGWRQGADVVALAQGTFRDACVTLHQDLAGLDRLVTVTVALS